jgi:glycosyltransferase involved in cell wall biosynthesis
MRLAIISQYYPPETGAPQNRLSDLAVRLVRRGHDVQVLTALPNYPGTAIHPEYVGRENMVETMDGVRVARVGLYVPREKRFIPRLRNYLSFAWNARRHGARLLHRPEVVLLESPPLFAAIAAVPLARRWQARLVVNVADLWPRTAVELGMIKPGPALWAAERLEAWMYRRADLVTGQTEGIIRDIAGRFPGKPTALYPNGVDLDAFGGPFLRDAVRAEFGWAPDCFVAGYAGVLGHAQGLDIVLDAALRTRETPRLHWALFGHGPCRDHLERRIATERIANAAVYPHQAREKMPHLQAAFDAGLAPLARGKVLEGARPSKMFEIMAVGRPVVLCARGESVGVLRSEEGLAGVVVEPEDGAALSEVVTRLAGAPDLARELGARGWRLVRERFDREQIANQIGGLLENLAAKHPHG